VGARGCAVGSDSWVTRGCTSSSKKKNTGDEAEEGLRGGLPGKRGSWRRRGSPAAGGFGGDSGERGCGERRLLYTSGRGEDAGAES